MDINVTLAKKPGPVNTFVLDEGSTVSDLLRAAEMELASAESIHVNGSPEDRSYILEDGDRVLITKNIKGNIA